MSEKNSPDEIKFDDFDSVVNLCSHPSRDLIAAGLLSGLVSLHSYSAEEKNENLKSFNIFKTPCRGLSFSPDGTTLFTASKGKSVKGMDVETGKVNYSLKRAHDDAISEGCLLVAGDRLIVTGDEEGYLKVWDTRKTEAIMSERCSELGISGLATSHDRKVLLVTSGDTLSAYNLRKKRFDLQSESLHNDLTCLAICKHGRKVVCGDDAGVFNIFNWSEWGNISDRFTGHPEQIDCLVKVNEDVLITGCGGIIRAVSILPNRFIGVIGGEEDSLLSDLALSRDKRFLASCSFENSLKFWNVENLNELTINPQAKGKGKAKRDKSLNKRDNFFSDL